MVVWKKHRLERLSLSSSLTVLNQAVDDSDYRRHGICYRSTAKYWIDHLEYLTDELIELQNKILEAAELFIGRELYAADIDLMLLDYPYLYDELLVQADKLELFMEKIPIVDELVAFEIVNKKDEILQFVSFAVGKALSLAKDMIWAHVHGFRCKEAAKSIQAQRLLNVMQLEMPRRVNDDLSRIFFRTLSELRKHQQWRQAKNIVDVTPKATKIND